MNLDSHQLENLQSLEVILILFVANALKESRLQHLRMASWSTDQSKLYGATIHRLN